MLSKGIYRGELYDIGYDHPEAHAVQKGDTMYYAFYADSYNGVLELRGLKSNKYKVINYVNDTELGNINGPVGKLSVTFKKYLLIKVVPN